MHRCHLAVMFAVLVVAFACREPNGPAATPDADANTADAMVGPSDPRDDLAPAIGTPEALDIATWNIENFPQGASTPILAAGIILSLDLDLIAVQEIANVAAFDELMAYLPDYDAVLSTDTYSDGSYQKVGFIFRRSLLQADAVDLLFTSDWYEFPRPPLEVQFTLVQPESGAPVLDFTAIVVHLKAGVDAEDRDRRRQAVSALDDYIRAQIAGAGDDQVLLLGDFNEDLEPGEAQTVWAPILDAPAVYTLHTGELNGASFSYIPWTRLIDHVISTGPLTDAVTTHTEIPPLDELINGYTSSVSDHRPVVTSVTGMW